MSRRNKSSSTKHAPNSSNRYLPFFSPMEALERGLNTRYNQQAQVSVNMEEGECSSEPGEEEYDTGCARANYPYYPSLSQLSDIEQCSEMESSDETTIAVRSTSMQQTTALSVAVQDTNESLRVTSSTVGEENGEMDKRSCVTLLNVDKTETVPRGDELAQDDMEDEVDDQIRKEVEKRNTVSAGEIEPMNIHAVSESQDVILRKLCATKPIEIHRVSESQAAVLKDLIVSKPVKARAIAQRQTAGTRPVRIHAIPQRQTASARPVRVHATSDTATQNESVTARPVEVRVISDSQAVILNDLCAHHMHTRLNNVHKPPSHRQKRQDTEEREEEMEVQEVRSCSLSPSSHSPDLFDSANSSYTNDIPVIDNEQLELLKGIKGWKLNKSIGFIRLDARRVVHHSSVASFSAPPIKKVWLYNLTFKDSKIEFSTRTITGNGLMRQRKDGTTDTQSQESQEMVEIYSYQSVEEEPEQVSDHWRSQELPHTSQPHLRTERHSVCENQTRRVQDECTGGDQSSQDLPSGSDQFDHELSAMAGSSSSGHVSAEDENKRRCKRPRTEEDRDSQVRSTSTSSEPTPLQYSLTPYQRPAEPPSCSTQSHNSNQSPLSPMPSKVASIIQGYWYMQKLQNRRKAAKM